MRSFEWLVTQCLSAGPDLPVPLVRLVGSRTLVMPIEVSGFPIECFLVPDATARLFVFDVSSPSSTVVAHGYSVCVTDERDAICTPFVDDALGPATSDAVSSLVNGHPLQSFFSVIWSCDTLILHYYTHVLYRHTLSPTRRLTLSSSPSQTTSSPRSSAISHDLSVLSLQAREQVDLLLPLRDLSHTQLLVLAIYPLGDDCAAGGQFLPCVGQHLLKRP